MHKLNGLYTDKIRLNKKYKGVLKKIKMKKNIYIKLFHNAVALGLAFVIFTASSMMVLAAADSKSLTGEITVSGQSANGTTPFVLLNGEQAFTGRTFFASGSFATAENINTTLKLGKAGYVTLSPNTNLSLNFDEKTISGVLSAGQIKVFNNEGVAVKIETADGVLSNEADQASTFTVDMLSGTTQATAENGVVLLNNGTSTAPIDRKKDDDDNKKKGGVFGGSVTAPVLVFAGIVTAAVIFAATNGNNDNARSVSPVR